MPSIAKIHRARSAAGKAGAQSRWANARREPTVQVRVFAADADWLKGQPGTIAENVSRLRKCGCAVAQAMNLLTQQEVR